MARCIETVHFIAGRANSSIFVTSSILKSDSNVRRKNQDVERL